MMAATRDTKPASFSVPSGIVAVEIDGASGRIATDDCRRASDAHVYTEYFARGTEPIDLCPLHRGGFLRALMVPSMPRSQAPVVVATEPPPTAAVAQSGTHVAAAAAQTQPPPKKKRGFWGRVFGVGK
jgi:hypothetical protein